MTPSTRLVCCATRCDDAPVRGTPSTRRGAQVADKESKLAAAATTLYNLARAVAPKFTDDTPEWS